MLPVGLDGARARAASHTLDPNLHLGFRANQLPASRGNPGRNSWSDGEGLWILEDHQEAWLSTGGDQVGWRFESFCGFLCQRISNTCSYGFYMVLYGFIQFCCV